MKNDTKQDTRNTINNLNKKQIDADIKEIKKHFKSPDNALLIFKMFCKTPEMDIATITKNMPISRQAITKIVHKLGDGETKTETDTSTGEKTITITEPGLNILSKVPSEQKWGTKYRYDKLYGSVAEFANNTTKTQNSDGLFLSFQGRELAETQANITSTKIKFYPYKYHNSKPNNTKSKNKLFIGDNEHVMRFIMPEYKEQIDLAYLDIPYNMDSNRVVQAYDSSFDGTCDLLSHLYPRLMLVKELLKPDGIIALSVNEKEMAYVKILMDEVFDRSNLVNNVVIEIAAPAGPISGFTHRHLIPVKSYLLVYAKKIKNIHLHRLYDFSVCTHFATAFNTIIEKQLASNPVRYTKTALIDYLKQQPKFVKLFKKYNLKIQTNNIETLMDYDTEFEEYVYKNLSKTLYKKTKPVSNPLKSDFNAPTDEVFEFDGKLLEKTKNNTVYHFKSFFDKLQENDSGKLVNTNLRTDIWKGYYSEKSKVQSEGGVSFSASKKPVKLLRDLLKWIGKKDAIVLEPYGGVSVVFHACMLQNKLDGGNRCCIICQTPEKVDPRSKEAKDGFSRIDQMTKKRMKNVIKNLGDTAGFQIYNQFNS